MAQHSEPVPGGISDPMERSGGAVTRRPGMVTFAAVIMFMVAGFEALSALLAFAGTGWWVTDAGNLVYANFVLWGILDLIIALIALYAGIDLLRGGTFGLAMGYLFAGRRRHQMAVCHPGGADTIGGGHRALRDGHLRARPVLRLLAERLSTSGVRGDGHSSASQAARPMSHRGGQRCRPLRHYQTLQLSRRQ